jgi:hypothetical protein
MKLNIALTYQYIVFLGMVLLVTPATSVHTSEKTNEIKTEKHKQQPLANENSSELLHSEMLFRF